MADQPNILIVDDEHSMAHSIAEVLESHGLTGVMTLTNPAEAIAHLASDNFDLVLLDIAMPGISGLQVLDAVAGQDLHTSFMIMTGDTSQDTAVEALRRGAIDYIRKPFDPDELLIRIDNAISRQELRSEHRRISNINHDLESQIRQSQKMEAIGALAGGVAHDFNNILTIILGNTELAATMLDDGHPAIENLRQVELASTRARELIKHLLTFSRNDGGGRKPLELNSLMAECLQLIRASIPGNVQIHNESMQSTLFIEGDATQIHQIIINLCTNAAQSMAPHGGELTANLSIAEPPGTRTDDKRYVRLSISDTGHGIEPENVERIFEPYFTTKKAGQGTGMGLAVVHGIVKSHHGQIHVSSTPGDGTSFEVFLPLSEKTDRPAAQGSNLRAATAGARILFVDDDEMVVDVTTRILGELGYEVQSFTDSQVALRAFEETPGAWDLLITDLSMPGMMGNELAQHVRNLRPTLPVILCSGFNDAVDRTQLEAAGIHDFLQKPAQLQEIARCVQHALAAPDERRVDERVEANDGVFVIFQSDPLKRGRVLDLSQSGIAVSMTTERSGNREDRLSIVSTKSGTSIRAMPFKLVSDARLQTGAQVRWRHGIHFEGLSESQAHELDEFLTACANNPA